MKAIIEVEFDKDIMFDEESVKDEFGGDFLKAMQWLFELESIGIFEEKLKLVGLK